MGLSHKFSRPLLIYDDKCYSCTKFAKAAGILSRGRIRTVGHYYSKEAIEAKKIIFPVDYDPTNMFWLINKKGAYGARSGLVQVAKEIIIGLFKGRDSIYSIAGLTTDDNCDSNLFYTSFLRTIPKTEVPPKQSI